MAHSPEDEPLARDSLAGSEEALVVPATPTGTANKRALKIAGLTTLAVLLVCSQVVTGYMLMDQRHQIHRLQVNSEKFAKQLARPLQAMSPMKMAMPMETLPLTMDFISGQDPKKTPPAQTTGQFLPEPAPKIKTKCQVESEATTSRFGSYRPKCDEQGHYHPVQCWYPTGYCWCVDEAGMTVKGTVMRGKPECGGRGSPPPRLIVN